MKSIRSELTTRLLGGTAVLLVAASTLLSIGIHSRIVGEFDRALEAKALALIALTSREHNYIEVDYSEDEMPDIENKESLDYFQVLFQDGTIIELSETLEEEPLPVDLTKTSGFSFKNIKLPDESRGRFVQISFLPRFDEEEENLPLNQIMDEAEIADLFKIPEDFDPKTARVMIAVARSRDRLDQLIIFLYGTLAAVDTLLLIGITIVTKSSIHRGLKPIEELNSQIRKIEPEVKDQKIVLEKSPEELQTILNALNDLLDKIQETLARERRFSSAVAHELRTPVAELRMACETGQRWPDDVECVRRLFQDNQEIALHMERIVTNLLELTRCDNKTSIIAMEEFQVGALIKDCWKRSSDIALKRDLSLDDRINPSEKVISDKAKLEIIIQNLIDNAVSYSVNGSVVVFSSVNNDGTLTLVIENETNNIEAIDLDHVFERFWRKDPARSVGNHTGLGLSLVRALADLLDIKVTIALPSKNTFQVQLTFLRPSHKSR